MARNSSLTVCAAAFGLMTMACGGGSASGAEGASDAIKLAQYEGPIASTDAAHGKEVYDKVCASCHDADQGGDEIANIKWPVAKVRMQIREGDSKMPPISEKRLNAEDMEALLAHLVTTSTVAQP